MAESKSPSSKPDDPPAPPEELSYSRDAQHSSYNVVSAPKDAPEYPPPGQVVEQTLGKPKEASE